MVWFPWVDISDRALGRYKTSAQLRTNFLNLGLLHWGKRSYEPVDYNQETDLYLSPSAHPFALITPLFINVGTTELFYDEIKLFAERMKKIEGNKVYYLETPNAPHDLIVAWGYTGFTKKAEDATKQANDFFTRVRQF
jgi:acetyl esterase/lipase